MIHLNEKSQLLTLAMFCCIMVFMMVHFPALAQHRCHITSYYDTDTNDPIHHIQGILQDKNGMIWLTTWGGLFSFDGKKFTKHSSHTDKSMSKSRGIYPCPTGDMWQLAGEKKDIVFTDRFGGKWHIDSLGKNYPMDSVHGRYNLSDIPEFKGYRGCFVDRQDNVWIMCYDSLHKLVFSDFKPKYVAETIGEPVRCMYRFSNGDYWLCQRNSKKVLVYDGDNHFKGYLSADGHIARSKVTFGASVYSIKETSDSTVWIGTRHKGLMKLVQGKAGNGCDVMQIGDVNAFGDDIYDIAEDRYGRLWLAMFDEGIGCLDTAENRIRRLPNYDYKNFNRAHHLALIGDTLAIASSEGLIIADISDRSLKNISFKYHCHDRNRTDGLSSNLTDYVLFDSSRRLFVCTENAGVDLCVSPSILDDKLSFLHIDNQFGLPEISYSLIELDGLYAMTGIYSISTMLINRDCSDISVSYFGPEFFGSRLKFVEIPPMRLNRDKWIVSTDSGALIINPRELKLDQTIPQIALTSLIFPDRLPLRYGDIPSEIVLEPDNRSFRIEFAALDYSNPDRVTYAYRLSEIYDKWILLGYEKSITFTDLPPGDYELQIKSSNGSGVWQDNTVSLKLHIPPRFIETIWAKILIFVLTV